jgi:protein TonB
MSPVSLAVPARPRPVHPSAVRPHPDAARIAAMSGAIALNLAIMLIATRPISPPLLEVAQRVMPVPTIHMIEPPKVIPKPPEIQMKPLAHVAVVPQPHALPHAVTPPVTAPVTDEPTANPIMSTPMTSPVPSIVPAAPVEATLAYRAAPMTFPVQALRQRMHGTVMLRVLVDETGKPIDAQVEHGSGYSLLDRSAREQVLAGWRFQPAIVDGRAVRAWAVVPVTFDLREM